MKAHAELRQVRPNTGSLWWTRFCASDAAELNRRASEVGAVYWLPARAVCADLFAYEREASLCYIVARYLSTISLSGAIVEIILNRDSRMSVPKVHRKKGWATLNNDNLRAAERMGLPVRLLLDSSEILSQHAPLRFVRLRNKIAHGDLADLPTGIPDYDPRFEQEARDQFLKAQNFLIEWFNSCPDIQAHDFSDQ